MLTHLERRKLIKRKRYLIQLIKENYNFKYIQKLKEANRLLNLPENKHLPKPKVN